MPASVASSARRSPGVRRRGPVGKPDVGRGHRLPAAAQEAAEVAVDHDTQVCQLRRRRWVALTGPASMRPSPGRRRSRIVGSHDEHDHHSPSPRRRPVAARRRPLPHRLHHPPPRRRQGPRPVPRLRRHPRRRRVDRRQLDHGDRRPRLDRHRQRRSRRPRPLGRPARRRAATDDDVRVDGDHRRRIGLDARSAT